MSSHHIVRDEQEPALLVLGFAESQWQVLQELLEWSPTVLVTSNLAERLLSKGVKIDWTIGDREAVSYEDYQSHIGFLGANEKGELLSALKFLVSRGYHAVNVMAIADQWDAISDYFLGSEVRLHVNVFQGGKETFWLPETSKNGSNQGYIHSAFVWEIPATLTGSNRWIPRRTVILY